MNRSGEVAPAGLYAELATETEVYTWDDLAGERGAGTADTGQETGYDWDILNPETAAADFGQPERIPGGLGTTHESLALSSLFRLHEISYRDKGALSIALTARPESVDGRPAREFGLAA